jgi:hypothetical protein
MEDRVGIIFALVVLLALGALIVFLGIQAGSVWVSALTFAGCLAVFAGANSARQEKFIAYVFWSVVGLVSIIIAMWMADMAGRFWWTPICFLLGSVYVTTGIGLRDEFEDLAAWISIVFGILLMVFSFLGPWLLYDFFQGTAPTVSFSVPSLTTADFSVGLVLGSAWDFLRMSFKSWWGVLYIPLVALLGRYWLGRWGWIMLPVLLLLTVGLLGWLFPETYAILVKFFSSSPVVWMEIILLRSQANLGSAAWGAALVGAAVSILLFPVYRESYRVNRLMGEVQNLRQAFGTTFAMNRMRSDEMSPLAVTASFLTIALAVTFAIATWMALQRLADQFGPLPFPLLGIPDLSLPNFRPVWMWNYFILPAITGVLVIIQNRVNASLRLVQPGGGIAVVTLFIVLIVGLFVPAGVFCFSIGQSLLLILSSPLAVIGLPKPRRQRRPISPPTPRPVEEDEPSLDELIQREIARMDRERRAQKPPETPIGRPAISDRSVQAVQRLSQDKPTAGKLVLAGSLLHKHTRKIKGLVIAENGSNYIIDSLSQLWELRARQAEKIEKLAIEKPDNLVLLPGNRLAVISLSGQLTIYALDPSGDHGEASASSPMSGYAVNPFGTILAYTKGGFSDSDVHALVLASNKEQILLSGVEEITVLAFSNDSRNLAIGTALGEVHLFDMASRTVEQRLTGNRLGEVNAIAADPTGGWVVTYSSRRCLYWNQVGEMVKSIKSPGRPTSLAIDASSRRVAIGVHSGEVVVTDPGLDQRLFSERVQQGSVEYVCFEPGGHRLVCADSQNHMRRVDIKTGS